jgi:hypothetical protein
VHIFYIKKILRPFSFSGKLLPGAHSVEREFRFHVPNLIKCFNKTFHQLAFFAQQKLPYKQSLYTAQFVIQKFHADKKSSNDYFVEKEHFFEKFNFLLQTLRRQYSLAQ